MKTVEIELKPIPPGAICCPKCGSPDTAKYKWPADFQSQIMALEHPDTRICVDCGEIWWTR